MARSVLLISSLILFFLPSCSSTDPGAPLIDRNPEVKEYFETLDDLVDEYCTMVENMMIDAQKNKLENKNDEKASMMDALKMFENMGSSMYKMMQLSEKIDAMKIQHPDFEKELSEVDFREFMQIYANMIRRFYDMGKKLEAMEAEQSV